MPSKPRTGFPGLYRKRGTYFVYQPPTPPGGLRPKPIYLGTTDQTEAILLAESIRRNNFVEDRSAPLRELVQAYLDSKRALGEHKGKATTHSATAPLNRFADWFRVAPAEIKPEQIREWKASMLAENLSRASVAGYLRYAQSFCSWLVRERRLLSNPFEGQKGLFPKSIPTRRDLALTKEWRDRLIDNCPDPHLKAVLFIGFYAGLRRNEILNIRPHWILTSGGRPSHFHVQNEADFSVKDSLAKRVPIAEPLADFLEEFGIDHSPYLIRPDLLPGKHQYRWEWKRRWNTYMKSQSPPFRVTPHTMRHTWFSLLLSAKDPPPIARLESWSGTAAAVIIKTYGHFFADADMINVAN